MQITLLQTGGMIPITKIAEKDLDWSEDELKKLIRQIRIENDLPGQARDAITFHLQLDEETFPIDWKKIPGNYKKAFEDLKDKLKTVRK